MYRQICGEAESVNNDDVIAWTEKILPDLLKDYSPTDVFNADEFGLFFKLMPDKSLVFKHEQCHGGKLSKERLSVLACTNATGTEKLRLFVIGKSRAPRCFKNVRSFPCDYQSQNRAWMTGDIFTTWIKKLDLSFKAQKRKILLFVDNCPAHPKDIPLDNIKLVFLPPNATSKLQPLDQGIIKVLKQKYRKKLVQRYLKEMETTTPAKKLNVLDSMHYVSAAWNEISPEIIKNCFGKAKFFHSSDYTLEESADDLRILEEYPGHAAIDDEITTSCPRSLEDLIADNPTAISEIEEESEDEEENEACTITVTKALDYVHDIKKLTASFDDASELLHSLNKIENFLFSKNTSNLRQTKLDFYFKRKIQNES